MRKTMYIAWAFRYKQKTEPIKTEPKEGIKKHFMSDVLFKEDITLSEELLFQK